MTTIKVLNNQSLIDIAVQTTGKAENVFWIALANDLVITDPITAGREITIPEGIEMDVEMVAFYDRKSILPATELDTQQQEAVEISCVEKLYNCFKF